MNFHRCCGALHRCWLLEEFPPLLDEFPPLLDEFPPLLDEFPPHAEEFPPCIVHMRRNSHRMRRNSHRTRRNFRPSGVSLPLVPRCISAVLLAISEDYFCFLLFYRFSILLCRGNMGYFLPSFLSSAFPNSKAHGNTNQGPRIRQGSRFLLRQCATWEFRPEDPGVVV